MAKIIYFVLFTLFFSSVISAPRNDQNEIPKINEMSIYQAKPRAEGKDLTKCLLTIKVPKVIADLQSILGSLLPKIKITLFTTEISLTELICYESIPVNMSLVDHVQLLPDGSVRVGVGATTKKVVDTLQKSGRKLDTAIFNTTRGLFDGSLINNENIIKGLTANKMTLTVVNPKGEIKNITNLKNYRALNENVGTDDLVAVIWEAIFKTVPTKSGTDVLTGLLSILSL